MQLEQDILDGAQHDFEEKRVRFCNIERKGGKKTRTFNLLGIRRTCIMGIDLLRRGTLVQAHEPMQEVITRGIIVVSACIIGEVFLERRAREFLGEEIDFVEEQDLNGSGRLLRKSNRKWTREADLRWRS